MTPKQKANKLYNDFAYDFVRCNVENASQKAKDAAIRCVDEIISAQWLDTGVDYWNEVKAEIYNVQPKNDMQCGVGKNNI
jgi:hypothetical protein